MKTIQLSKLKEQYKFVCEQYLQKFINKHNYEFTGWIGDEVGGIAVFIEQYFFNMDDIIYDVNNKLPKDMVFRWQDDNLEAGYDSMINLHAYSKGMRPNGTVVEPETQSNET